MRRQRLPTVGPADLRSRRSAPRLCLGSKWRDSPSSGGISRLREDTRRVSTQSGWGGCRAREKRRTERAERAERAVSAVLAVLAVLAGRQGAQFTHLVLATLSPRCTEIGSTS